MYLSSLLRMVFVDALGRAWMVTHVRDECEPSLWDDPAPGSIAAVTIMHAGRYVTLRLHTQGAEVTMADVARELHRFITTEDQSDESPRTTQSA